MFVKLFQSIMKSSVWDESPTTRLVWITFLLLADEDGMVKGVEKGMARAANVSPEEFRVAVAVLEARDIDSQSQEWGGRRVEKVEGGWMVLNYRKYREYRTRAQVKDAGRQARKRAKDKGLESQANATDRDVSRPSRPVHTIASVSSSVLQLPNAVELEKFSEVGEHLNWCSECGGMKERIGPDARLKHREFCSRRTG